MYFSNTFTLSSGLDDLSCLSAKDDEDYDGNIELAARQIEYSDSNPVRHGRWQTNFIPGGPKQPLYNGTSATEKVTVKQEYKRVRKTNTDRLRLKRLKEQNGKKLTRKPSLVVKPLAYDACCRRGQPTRDQLCLHAK